MIISTFIVQSPAIPDNLLTFFSVAYFTQIPQLITGWSKLYTYSVTHDGLKMNGL